MKTIVTLRSSSRLKKSLKLSKNDEMQNPSKNITFMRRRHEREPNQTHNTIGIFKTCIEREKGKQNEIKEKNWDFENRENV